MATQIRGKNGNFVPKTKFNVVRHHVRSKKLLVPIVGLIAMVGAVVVFKSQAATAPMPVFVGTDKFKLFRIASDKSTTKELASQTGTYNTHLLSRDKSKIAVRAYDNTVKIINATTGAHIKTLKTNVDVQGYAMTADWLPGDTGLVYVSRSNQNGIYTINASTGAMKKIITESKPISDVWVQPGGSKLLYSVAGVGIKTASLDGTGKKQIASDWGSPRWSSDGRRVAYTSTTISYTTEWMYKNTLMVMNSDGGGKTAVTTLYNGGEATQAQRDDRGASGIASGTRVWSNGSSTILFQRSVKGVINLYQVNVSTKQTIPITSNKATTLLMGPYGWTKDNRIVYCYGAGLFDLNVVKSVKADLSGARILYEKSTANGEVESVTF